MTIQEITLFTSDIQKQKQFYKQVLNFEQILDTPEKISFKTGKSTLIFQCKPQTKPAHLAFNIPSNAIYDALIWLKQRIEILPFEGEPIVDFNGWKAKSVYFYDTDHNILEFIARERINIESDTAFNPNTILSISEIAMVTDHIEPLFETINSINPINVFDGDFDRFCALGNDEGLFIMVDKNKKTYFPTMEEAFTSDFIIKGDYNFSFENGKIKEIS
ncbi:hypothetical protein GCM10007962_20890 [Yeosuana aromativorans]|uniref:VOC domain-containing protein n=1 Tax=Yeosuana aromativorans TaxID=288019 RepID=A0A8J3BKR5_9FLAO|nr:VOC family protein [Yeosuana aromativorans]GGK26401.1 hypothetical protein GCM10007962_20890 [Yeosuana aromativorans]